MDYDGLPAAETKPSPPAPVTASPGPTTAAIPSALDTVSSIADSTRSTSRPVEMDHSRPHPFYDAGATAQKDDGDPRSTFRGPGGSPILERTSPMQHRPYQSSVPSVADRRESNSVSPTLTRQDNSQNALRMLPPPSPPTQRHQGSYTGVDLPPLSSVTGLHHRPPSSGSMSISSMLGGTSTPSDLGMHSHHHHHSGHHHHRPPRPYTPEYGNLLGPTSSSTATNPLAPRSQSMPTTPALGYPETDSSSHGRNSSYGRLPSNAGVLPTPFRDTMYRGYTNRDPLPHQREEFPPRPREVMNLEPPASPPPPPPPPSSTSQHLAEIQKSNNSYSHQGKPSGLSTGIPPPAPHHQPLNSPQPPRPVTNGSSSRSNHHHHHHRPPPSQPIARQPPPPQPRPPPKLHVNNAPALDAVANINPKPFLGRFIYEPGWIVPAAITEGNLGGRFEVRIAQRFLGRDNEGVVRRKLWGTGVYTDDSDIVAILYHTQTLPQPPLSKPKDVAAHFIILPTLQHYAPSTLNEIRSRGWKTHDGYSIYLERAEWITPGSAEGVWRGRKRRLDEELRMGADEDGVGVVGSDTGNVGVFKGVNWNIEQYLPNRRGEDGEPVGLVV